MVQKSCACLGDTSSHGAEEAMPTLARPGAMVLKKLCLPWRDLEPWCRRGCTFLGETSIHGAEEAVPALERPLAMVLKRLCLPWRDL